MEKQTVPFHSTTVEGKRVDVYHVRSNRRFSVYHNGKLQGYMIARTPIDAVNRVESAGKFADFVARLQKQDNWLLRREGKLAPARAKPAKGKPAKGKPAKGKPAKGKPAKGKPAKGKPAKGKPAKAPSLGDMLATPVTADKAPTGGKRTILG